jgi:DMSO/TMAO reductase YedYZ molybdopterin-dependent catalytic subunit
MTLIPVRLPPLGKAEGLPPGQNALANFPRFGTQLSGPTPRVRSSIRIDGQVESAFDVELSDLAHIERAQITADFHCVAGWSFRGLRWEGVPFATFYDTVIRPRIRPGADVTHLLLRGADGFEAGLLLDDVRAENVLLADRLDGEPLSAEHGAPVRLVSPSQYGYKSVKHLTAIEVHVGEPAERHPDLRQHIALSAVRAHPRARVALEERHRYLPSWAVRWPYRNVIYPVFGLLARLQSRP